MTLRFELRIIDTANDEEVVTDFATFDADQIDQFGGCEQIDMHVASSLRFMRRLAREAV